MENRVYHGVAEGAFTGALESQTSRIPSSGYLAALWRDRHLSHFEDSGQG